MLEKKVCILLLNTTPFSRLILYIKMIENDFKWSDIVIFMLEKKVCILLLPYTFFPRPVFDTKVIENDLQRFKIMILMS